MRKTEEIEHFKKVLQDCPEGYFKSLLRHLEPEFALNTQSDFDTLPDIRELERQLGKTVIELAALQNRIRNAERNIETLNREEARIMKRIDALREEGKQLAAKFSNL